jgi:hypothetical protein
MSTPPVIHLLWFQGLPHAPEIVRVCVARWRLLNPGYKIKIYHFAHVEALLGKSFPIGAITHQALSDIFRIALLLEQGGIWADATVYPVRPLETWFPELISATDFFAFAQPGPDRPISSWFLAASPGHAMMKTWWREIVRFWSTPRSLVQYPSGPIPPHPLQTVSPSENTAGAHPYYWLHYLFHYCLETDPAFRATWAETEKIPAAPALALDELIRATPSPTAVQVREILALAPVQKLNWRLPYSLAQGSKEDGPLLSIIGADAIP